MQTGKETAQVHTVSLDSAERAFPDAQWKTGKRARFPWTGFTALMIVVFCAISSVIVLLISNGRRQEQWADKIGPNVLLSGFNGVSNICFGIAIGNGVAITWWRKALKGATIQDLHRSWAFSASIKDVVLYGKYFNFIALAALAAKLTIIDGILLQKAATTEVGPDPQRDVTLTLSVNSTMPFTGLFDTSGDTYYPEYPDWFAKVIDSWSHNSGVLPNDISDCQGVCLFQVNGTGFEIDCTSAETNVDYASLAYQASVDLLNQYDNATGTSYFDDTRTLYYDIFNITFMPIYGTTGVGNGYSTIEMRIQTTITNQTTATSCPSTLIEHVCTLRPAIVQYPVTIEVTPFTVDNNPQLIVSNMYLGYNTTSYGGVVYYQDWDTVPPYDKSIKQQSNVTFVRYEDVLENHDTETRDAKTVIGGIASALDQYLAGLAQISYNATAERFKVFRDRAAEGRYNVPAPADHGCNYTFEDPLNDIVNQINLLMFALSMNVWELDYPDFNSTIYMDHPAMQYSTSIHYKTNPHFMYGAIASIIVCILCVLPSYYGYWQLGREVTLGPFEIANAFRAPVLDHPAVANAGVKDLIREVGNRQVKYGEMIHHDAPGRLAIAEPESIRRVHPKLHG
ncbi:hypothetical protein E4T47_06963 [Aureobasidium subglaciale]|nr:hypothetical protein E4T47_06963 [Aureobasidium subglaciale]